MLQYKQLKFLLKVAKVKFYFDSIIKSKCLFQITDEEGSVTNLTETQFTCSFLRPFNVTKNVAGNEVAWTIETANYYLLYAEGYVHQDGSLYIHSQRTSTPTSFNLLSRNDDVEIGKDCS